MARPWERRIDEPVLHVVSSLHWHSHRHIAGWHLCDTIWVLVSVFTRAQESIHVHATDTLSNGDGALLVREQHRLQVHNLLAKLCHSSGQRVVLRTVQLNLALKVGQPLLLPLAALEGGDPIRRLATG